MLMANHLSLSHPAPFLYPTRETRTAIEGGTVSFSFIVLASPPIETIQWFYQPLDSDTCTSINDLEVLSDGVTSLTFSSDMLTLTISGLVSTSAGLYYVTVSNALGTASGVYYLTLSGEC